MKKNKEIKVIDSVNYMNSLFNELTEKKIKLYTMCRPLINDKLEILLPDDVNKKMKEVEKFENFVWDEYERLVEELRELEYEE